MLELLFLRVQAINTNTFSILRNSSYFIVCNLFADKNALDFVKQLHSL